ncbi:hypothetical protein AZI85_12015 [Bdellovibrio bacteriovorus]|uniref:histidine kinase n=1 Tax=Bdellovibrio bacteriovorus TaxID=959 RepID=A0A150WCX0_BDEBC|nr:response regulator [Bdellovibrio bacteriovorus]KYG60712.1 hypothetical protein AZI85_12015 [Bdellovibrio bacteriovorus]
MSDNSNHGSLELEVRRIDLLYKQNIAGMLAIFFNTIAFATVAWGSLSPIFITIWFSVLNLSALARFFAYYRWNRSRNSIRSFEETRPWLYFMFTSLFISGCGWGAIGLISHTGSLQQQVLTALLVSCMVAGALVTYVSSRLAMACVIVPAMFLWGLGTFISRAEFSMLMGTLIILYSGLLVLIGKNLNLAVMKSLSLDVLRKERDLHEAANRAKSVFLANASHEIRTPLSAILGFSEALLRSDSLSEQNRHDVQAIHRQSNYMVSLVNDLLDLSKIETNRLYIQKAPMSPIREIDESLSVIRPVAAEKKVQLEVKYLSLVPESIMADSVRFRQVLINLLTNAVKFTSEGSVEVLVNFTSDIHHQGTLNITVTDTGLGMDKLTQQNLFQPFVRGEHPDVQRVQGSGLGLALSLSLMKMMGGDLRLVSSVLGQGSSFEMSMKLGNSQELRLMKPEHPKMIFQEKIKIAKEAEFLKGRRVLVVDDSVDLRVLMKRFLSRSGAEVETAENGAQAVEYALNQPFDVILMDIKMPVMDGYKATSVLREKGYRHPIVALTAQASVDGQQKSFELGFDGYLSKPVDMNLLSEILRRSETVS